MSNLLSRAGISDAGIGLTGHPSTMIDDLIDLTTMQPGDAAAPMSSLLSSARLHYTSLPIPGDECETWTREQLEAMNARFVAAFEETVAGGLERRESAAREVKLPTSPRPRWSTPLCSTVLDSLLRSATSASVVVRR